MGDPAIGVDDPYAYVDACDHLTDDGRCRFAFESFEADPVFARARRDTDFQCPVVTDAGPTWEWQDCPNLRATTAAKECVRCGLAERRHAHADVRPLIEEHHLSYPTDGDPEITVGLCRWCHTKVHESWASLSDAASPNPEAIAARESRRSEELDESSFQTAADRADLDDQ